MCIRDSADIVIFDYENMIDRADYVGFGEPDAPPQGIRYVLVNGRVVVRDGTIVGPCDCGKFVAVGP